MAQIGGPVQDQLQAGEPGEGASKNRSPERQGGSVNPSVVPKAMADRLGFGCEGNVVEARRPDPDAVRFHDDGMANGALAFCASRGLSVPGEPRMTGRGGMEAASVLPRRRPTTVVPTATIGKAATEGHLDRLQDAPGPDVVAIPTRLVPDETL